MIIFRNESADPGTYDVGYDTSEPHFKNRTASEELTRLLLTEFPAGARSALDIGCGQGQMLALVHEDAMSRGHDVRGERFVGVDASIAGIRFAEREWPQLAWVQDEFGAYLDRELARAPSVRASFDLVIMKSGLTFVSDERTYLEIVRRTGELMSPQGIYFFFWNKSFYQKWLFGHRPAWSSDPIELTSSVLGTPEVVANKGYHILVYRKDARRRPAAGSDPFRRRIDRITLSPGAGGDGQDDVRFVKHMDHCQLTLAALTRPSWQRLWAVEGSGGERDTGADAPLAVVSAPESRRHWPDGLKALITASGYAPVGFPRPLTNLRRVSREIDLLLAPNPRLLVLGCSAQDHAPDEETGKPAVEPDEFASRLDWLSEECRARGCILSYLEPEGDGSPRIEPYAALLRERAADGSLSLIGRTASSMAGADSIATDGRRTPLLGRAMRALVGQTTVGHGAEGLCFSHPPAAPRKPEALPGRGPVPYLVASSARIDIAGERLLLSGPDAELVDLATRHQASDRAEGKDYQGAPVLTVLGGRTRYERLTQRRIIAWLARHEQKGLPRAMIIGDSIRMRIVNGTGYGLAAYRRLVGRANLAHVPHNCGGSRSGRDAVDDWMAARPELVLYNCGLHDLTRTDDGQGTGSATSIEEYMANLEHILARMRAGGARHVIWATITPVDEEWHRARASGEARRVYRLNADVDRYNEAALAVARRHGCAILDLHGLMTAAGVRDCLVADGVHLSAHGADVLGAAVAAEIAGRL